MTFRVIILPQAHRDIDRNADWWAENHSVEQTLRWADAVYDQIETLAELPESHGLSAENDEFPYEIRDKLIGLGSRFHDYSDIQIGVLPADSPHRVYAFDSDRLVLTQGDAPAEPVVTTTLAPNFQWGLMSGPLFNPTSTNLDKLACDMDGDSVNESTCGWLGWSELDEYYTWETGPNDWNQFTALENPSDGTILKFDPPLLVTYTHTWPDTTQSVFYLEYSGFGNLNGIPGKCVDPDTGEEMPCGPDSRWLPQFNIVGPNNQVTDSTDNVTKYYVKPLEMEQQMLEADPVNCETLMLKNYTLPDLATWVNPNIGPEPDVPGYGY